jgi:hypothetical protein
MNPRLFYSCLGFLLLFPCTGYGQWKEPPATGSPQNTLPDRTTMVGQSGMGPLLIAKLIDRDANAKKHQAVVAVQTDGVRLVDSAAANHEPRLDEAHIQYRLDDAPAQDSTSKTWTFAKLSSGEHRIRVTLVSSDNHPMGKDKVLKVRVP